MCFQSLCTVKILYFVWFGATSCLLPFLSLHMRTLGVPPMTSAIISGTLPLLQLVSCPLAFGIAKRTTSYKKTTTWFLLLAATATVLLVFSPRIPTPHEKTIGIHFQCGPSVQPAIIVDKCNYECEDSSSLSEGIDAYFTECHVDCPGKKGNFKNTADLCFDDQRHRVCHVVEVNNTLSEKFTFGIYLARVQEHGEKQCLYPMEGVNWHQSLYHHVSCPIILTESNIKCALRCDLQEVTKTGSSFSLSGLHTCLNEGPDTIRSAIWMYSCLRAVFHFFLGIATVLVERGMLHVLKVENRDRSNYVVCSLVSAGVFTPFAGLVIDTNAGSDFVQSYDALILIGSCMLLISVTLTSSMDLDNMATPSLVQTFAQMQRLLKELEVTILFAVVFLLGVISGYLDTFLFWHLEDLSCPHYVMGATVTVGLIIGLPSNMKRCAQIPNKIAPGYLICICLFLQCVRCIGYYFAKSFWWCLLVELSGTAAFHLLWASIFRYNRILASKSYRTALEASTGTLHYGLGRSCGAFAGGAMMAVFGFATTFVVFGSASGVLAIIYLAVYHFLLRQLPKNLKDMQERQSEKEQRTEENGVNLLKIPVRLSTMAANELQDEIHQSRAESDQHTNSPVNANDEP